MTAPQHTMSSSSSMATLFRRTIETYYGPRHDAVAATTAAATCGKTTSHHHDNDHNSIPIDDEDDDDHHDDDDVIRNNNKTTTKSVLHDVTNHGPIMIIQEIDTKPTTTVSVANDEVIDHHRHHQNNATVAIHNDNDDDDDDYDTLCAMLRQERNSYRTYDYFASLIRQHPEEEEPDSSSALLCHTDASCRTQMILWCYQLANYLHYHHDTVEMAVSIIDRYMMSLVRHDVNFSRHQKDHHPSNNAYTDRTIYQLVCMTSFYMAIKIHETTSTMDVDVMVQLSRQTITAVQMTSMEYHILHVLQYKMNPPTSFSYIRIYLSCHETQLRSLLSCLRDDDNNDNNNDNDDDENMSRILVDDDRRDSSTRCHRFSDCHRHKNHDNNDVDGAIASAVTDDERHQKQWEMLQEDIIYMTSLQCEHAIQDYIHFIAIPISIIAYGAFLNALDYIIEESGSTTSSPSCHPVGHHDGTDNDKEEEDGTTTTRKRRQQQQIHTRSTRIQHIQKVMVQKLYCVLYQHTYDPYHRHDDDDDDDNDDSEQKKVTSSIVEQVRTLLQQFLQQTYGGGSSLSLSKHHHNNNNHQKNVVLTKLSSSVSSCTTATTASTSSWSRSSSSSSSASSSFSSSA